jgi:uncharacterized RDD family membrane protein YckC
MSAPPPAAGLMRRLFSMLYEALIVAGVVMIAGLLFVIPAVLLTGEDTTSGPTLWLFRLYLFATLGLYFGWFWMHGGQTLPMRAWRLRLVDARNQPVSRRAALLRYLYAWPSVLAGGLGLAWALVDRDRQFLHDRLAGTRMVRVEPSPAPSAAASAA